MGSVLRRALGALRDAPVKTATQYCWHSCALRGSFIAEQWARQAPKGSFGLAPAGSAKETAASVSAPAKSKALAMIFFTVRSTCAALRSSHVIRVNGPLASSLASSRRIASSTMPRRPSGRAGHGDGIWLGFSAHAHVLDAIGISCRANILAVPPRMPVLDVGAIVETRLQATLRHGVARACVGDRRQCERAKRAQKLCHGSSLLFDQGKLGRVSSRLSPRVVGTSHGEETAI